MALAKVMEAYARKYQFKFSEKGDRESWVDHLRHLINVAAGIYIELYAEDVSREALEHLEEYEKNGKPFGYAHLTSDEKKAIHQHLAKIRSTLEKSTLDDRKKRAIYSRLSKLAAEVDKDGTSTDIAFAFIGELSYAVSGIEKQNRPIIDHAKDILKIIFNRRAEDEGSALPAPEDFPLLPP